MTWVEAIVLGIVQGLTEFLPISSSAHLRIASALFFHHDAGASFTAVTQLGTEAAVLIYFAKDIWRLTRTWFAGLVDADVRRTVDYRLAWYVIIGTLPIGILGYLLKDAIREPARNLWLVSTNLIVFALFLAAAEYWGRQKRAVGDMTLRDGVIMGLAQAMALVPGVSRSGGTITAVVASGIFSLGDVFHPSGAGVAAGGAQIAVATVIAFFLGYASIAWLLRYVARHSVYIFVAYRILLGGFVLALLTAGVISAT